MRFDRIRALRDGLVILEDDADRRARPAPATSSGAHAHVRWAQWLSFRHAAHGAGLRDNWPIVTPA
jgi:hypothetical protein